MIGGPLRALTAALLLCLARLVSAQAMPPPPPPPPPPPIVEAPQQMSGSMAESPSQLSGPASFSISGVVISATTGTPLDRAELTLTTPGPAGSTVATTVTGENGAFRFDRLQAGKYRLEAFRRGYMTSGYQEHEGFTTGIATGPNLTSSGLRFELLPNAVIGGTVTDDAGEPVAGAQVRLFRRDDSNGESRIVGAGNDMTDDTGVYEFARLRPGTYFVAVLTTPWYAFHPGKKTDENGDDLPPEQQPRSPLDVAYATTYYPNALDSDSASPLAMNAGDRIEADFSLHAVPAVHIELRTPAPEGRNVQTPILMQPMFGSEQNQPGAQIMMAYAKNGMTTIDYAGVAPGHYILRQFGPQGDSSRTAGLDLTSNVTVDFAAVASQAGVDVSGKIAMASGAQLPNRTRVALVGADEDRGRRGELVAADGTFTLHNVSPGNYELQLMSAETRLAVLQMMASGAEAQGNHITVASQPVLIAATLARGTTTLNGYAERNGKGLGGAMIFLVPHDPARHDLYRRDQTSTDGSFTLNRVIPGDYTVVAIENGWTLDWGRPEVMTPYLARGVHVRIAGQKTLDLPTPVEVQLR